MSKEFDNKGVSLPEFQKAVDRLQAKYQVWCPKCTRMWISVGDAEDGRKRVVCPTCKLTVDLGEWMDVVVGLPSGECDCGNPYGCTQCALDNESQEIRLQALMDKKAG